MPAGHLLCFHPFPTLHQDDADAEDRTETRERMVGRCVGCFSSSGMVAPVAASRRRTRCSRGSQV